MSNDGPMLDRDGIIAALTVLGERLLAQGVHADIFIVGGAAMALAYSDRRLTTDIDAQFEPKMLIYETADEVAREMGLPEGWLNDGAKTYMPGRDGQARPIQGIPGIEVTVASPEYLLTMKLLAMRMGEDDDDIITLLDMCGITSAQEAIDLVERMNRGQKTLPRARFWLQQYFEGEE